MEPKTQIQRIVSHRNNRVIKVKFSTVTLFYHPLADNRATDQGALTMIAMSTTEPITENGGEDETLINLSNLSQDDLPSITSKY